MDIKIPKIVIPVDFGGYAQELKGQLLYVWVNPPLEKMREHDEVLKALNRAPAPDADFGRGDRAPTEDGEGKRFKAWYAEIWSQGKDEATRWTADELEALEEQDPALLSWMVNQTWQVRSEHISKKKRS